MHQAHTNAHTAHSIKPPHCTVNTRTEPSRSHFEGLCHRFGLLFVLVVEIGDGAVAEKRVTLNESRNKKVLVLATFCDHHWKLGFVVRSRLYVLDLTQRQQSINEFSKHHMPPIQILCFRRRDEELMRRVISEPLRVRYNVSRSERV